MKYKRKKQKKKREKKLEENGDNAKSRRNL